MAVAEFVTSMNYIVDENAAFVELLVELDLPAERDVVLSARTISGTATGKTLT